MFKEGEKIKFQKNGFHSRWSNGVFMEYISETDCKIMVDGKTRYTNVEALKKVSNKNGKV